MFVYLFACLLICLLVEFLSLQVTVKCWPPVACAMPSHPWPLFTCRGPPYKIDHHRHDLHHHNRNVQVGEGRIGDCLLQIFSTPLFAENTFFLEVKKSHKLQMEWNRRWSSVEVCVEGLERGTFLHWLFPSFWCRGRESGKKKERKWTWKILDLIERNKFEIENIQIFLPSLS